jgi:tripartite-type tricarboxylate transporter receptor subunit TctC
MKKILTNAARTAFLGALLSSNITFAQNDFPNKPIRIIVPFATGGGTSNAARLVGEKMTEKWGKPVIIENRPGGNTVIGAELVAKSPADGYTLFFANTSLAINPSLMAKLPYDTNRDFTPVTPLLVNPFVLLVHPSVPASNLQEFIKLVRANPENWPMPTVGAAGIGRVTGEIFNEQIKVKLTNIPYKGTSQLATDLLGGQIKHAIEIPGVYIPHIKAGKLKALAVTGNKRLAALPDVPTFAEAGMPDFNSSSWYGLMAPAGTPPATIQTLSSAIQQFMQSDDVKQKLSLIEAEPLIGGPSDFGALIKKETDRFSKVIRAARIESPN